MRDTPIRLKDRVTNERVTLSFLYGSFLVHQEFGVIDIINVVVEDNKAPL